MEEEMKKEQNSEEQLTEAEKQEEQKKAMEEMRKQQMEQQKKAMEEQKKQMEEQKKMKKVQLEITLKQLEVNKIIVEKTIARMTADKEVIEKVDLAAEENEVKKNALKAKMDEFDALAKGEELKLEMIALNKENVNKQLQDLDKMPMNMPGGMMPPGMGRGMH
ncbi:MAG: hypothetical protein ABIA37_01585 [Candidatus Woesearchaeota archaeon]